MRAFNGNAAWLAALLALASTGCGQQAAAPMATPVDPARHQHDEWWCAEHGVPESVCGLCDSKLAADFKKKGDWCDEHDRPESQCFACHPERQAEFAAQYEAKYGKQPPAPAELAQPGAHDHQHARAASLQPAVK